MAAARSVLRATASSVVAPGETLSASTSCSAPTSPSKMFVTCLYGVIDPATGRFRFANAGHNLPVRAHRRRLGRAARDRHAARAAPGMTYEEKEAWIAPGESLLLYCDGVTEAHSTEREMYGTPRLAEFVAGEGELIDGLLTSLAGFTGDGWEQEDDITLVTLRRTRRRRRGAGARATRSASRAVPATSARRWSASPPRSRRSASSRAGSSSSKTAVAEAAMNAIEHGNDGRAELPVDVEVVVSGGVLTVRITDEGDRRADRRGRDARPRRQARRAAEAARLGAVPDREHGRRDPRLRRGRPAHGRARPEPGRGWRGWRPLSWKRACTTRPGRR